MQTTWTSATPTVSGGRSETGGQTGKQKCKVDVHIKKDRKVYTYIERYTYKGIVNRKIGFQVDISRYK